MIGRWPPFLLRNPAGTGINPFTGIISSTTPFWIISTTSFPIN